MICDRERQIFPDFQELCFWLDSDETKSACLEKSSAGHPVPAVLNVRLWPLDPEDPCDERGEEERGGVPLGPGRRFEALDGQSDSVASVRSHGVSKWRIPEQGSEDVIAMHSGLPTEKQIKKYVSLFTTIIPPWNISRLFIFRQKTSRAHLSKLQPRSLFLLTYHSQTK